MRDPSAHRNVREKVKIRFMGSVASNVPSPAAKTQPCGHTGLALAVLGQAASPSKEARRVTRFCSFVTIALLLAVPALRLLHCQLPQTTSLDSGPVFTAEAISEKAAPLMAGLAPGHGEIQVTRSAAGRADGSTQRLWCVINRPAEARTGETADLPDIAELRYDADTGDLIFASTTCDLNGHPYVPGRTPQASVPGIGTAEKAVKTARAWLPKLGMIPSGKTTDVVFAPQEMASGVRRVWLRGYETPEGPSHTVEVAVSPRTGGLIRAVFVERAALPKLYLPQDAPNPETR